MFGVGYRALVFANAAETAGPLVAVAGIALPESIADPREIYPKNSRPEPVKDDP